LQEERIDDLLVFGIVLVDDETSLQPSTTPYRRRVGRKNPDNKIQQHHSPQRN
jgi:hypothetical protein